MKRSRRPAPRSQPFTSASSCDGPVERTRRAARCSRASVPSAPYRWVDPPPDFAAGNIAPKSNDDPVPLTRTGSPTGGNQRGLTAHLEPSGGCDAHRRRCRPRRRASSPRPDTSSDLSAGQVSDGNAYRLSVLYRPSGDRPPVLPAGSPDGAGPARRHAVLTRREVVGPAHDGARRRHRQRRRPRSAAISWRSRSSPSPREAAAVRCRRSCPCLTLLWPAPCSACPCSAGGANQQRFRSVARPTAPAVADMRCRAAVVALLWRSDTAIGAGPAAAHTVTGVKPTDYREPDPVDSAPGAGPEGPPAGPRSARRTREPPRSTSWCAATPASRICASGRRARSRIATRRRWRRTALPRWARPQRRPRQRWSPSVRHRGAASGIRRLCDGGIGARGTRDPRCSTAPGRRTMGSRHEATRR